MQIAEPTDPKMEVPLQILVAVGAAGETPVGEAGEGTFDIIEPVGGHQDLPDNFFDDYQAQ